MKEPLPRGLTRAVLLTLEPYEFCKSNARAYHGLSGVVRPDIFRRRGSIGEKPSAD